MMAEMKQMVNEKNLFNDTWLFFKKYEQSERTDESWDRIMTEAENICEKYRNTPVYEMAADMLTIVVKRIDAIQITRSKQQCA